MRYVITGAGGFLGRNVVSEVLENTGAEILAVSSKPPKELIWQLASDGNTANRSRIEVVEPTELLGRGILSTSDKVINCAFPWNTGGENMAAGIEFLTELFSTASRENVATFVNVSSQSVYRQDRESPADEESPVECDTTYSTAKYALERAADAVFGEGINVNARLSSLVGAGYDIRIVNRFINQAKAGEPLVVFGGEQSFDFMDVRDAARALVLIAREGHKGFGDLNVGSSNPLNLREIATLTARVMENVLMRPVLIDWRDSKGDNRSLALDCTRLKRQYGFRPKYTLADSITWICNESDRIRGQ